MAMASHPLNARAAGTAKLRSLCTRRGRRHRKLSTLTRSRSLLDEQLQRRCYSVSIHSCYTQGPSVTSERTHTPTRFRRTH